MADGGTVRIVSNLFSEVAAGMGDAALRGLSDAGEVLLDESTRVVPVDDAILKGSASVTKRETAVIVSYDTPYAVVQHEDQTLRHPRGGQAKYLEGPLRSNQGRLVGIVADAIRREGT